MVRGSDIVEKSRSSIDNAIAQSKQYFERQLVPLGLSKEKIQQQTLEELSNSLETVNDAIKLPEAFGVLKLKVTADAGAVLVTNSSDAHYEFGILPTLLERKKSILERIKLLQEEKKIDSLKEEIEQADSNMVAEIQKEIIQANAELERLQKQFKEENQTQEIEKSAHNKDLVAVEVFERRSRALLPFLERESVASIVGAFLLMVLVISMIIAMFRNVTTSEVVNNSLMLVLGYFFGQTVNKTKSSEKNM